MKSIAEAFLSCSKTKKFNDITVSDILEKSGVGRSTFYRHFDSLTDVVAFECDNIFANIHLTPDESNLFVNIEKIVKENSAFFDQVILADENVLIYYAMRRNIRRFMKESGITEEYDDDTYELIASMLSSVIFSLHTIWVEKGRPDDTSALINEASDAINIIHSHFSQRIGRI